LTQTQHHIWRIFGYSLKQRRWPVMPIDGQNGRGQGHTRNPFTSQLRHDLRRRIDLIAAKWFKTSQ
jgi:hypothetical protein